MFWPCNKNPTQNWEAKIYAIKHEDPSLPAPELRKLSESPMQVTAETKGKKPAPKVEKKPVVETPKKGKKLLHGTKVKNTHKQVGKASKTPEPLNLNHPLAIKQSRAQIQKLKRSKEDADIAKMISEFHAEQSVEARKAAASVQSLVQANAVPATPAAPAANTTIPATQNK